MLSIEQIRAARALLDWSQSDLADKAGLSQTGIARIENGTNQPNSKTLAKIQKAFDDAHIEFLGETGLRKKTGEIRTLRNEEGFNEFMLDVYETIKKIGGEICVSNVDERKWAQYSKNDKQQYLKKVSQLHKKGNFDTKILIKEGDNYTPAIDYAQYKWTAAENFGSVPFYVYGNKTAMILFDETDENVTIFIIENKEIADAQRKQFNIAWDSASSIFK